MKVIFLAMLLVCACSTLSAQTDSTQPTVATTDTTKTIDTIAMAKVYIIRSTGHVGSAVNLRLVVDSVMRCKVRNNRYAIFYAEPGIHLFNATSWDKPGAPEKFGLKIPVEAGKTYYMSMHIKQRFMGIEIYLQEITYNTASPLLAKYKLDECN